MGETHHFHPFKRCFFVYGTRVCQNRERFGAIPQVSRDNVYPGPRTCTTMVFVVFNLGVLGDYNP